MCKVPVLRPGIYNSAAPKRGGETYTPEGLNVKTGVAIATRYRKAPNMARGNKQVLTAYMTPDEYENIKAAAGQARLSVSRFARAVCLGYELKSKVDHEAVLALLKANRDLSRLGNLLKLALDQSNIDENKINDLLNSIEETKGLLNGKVKAI